MVVTLHDYHLLCDSSTLLRPDGALCAEGTRASCTSCLRRHPILAERWPGEEREAVWARAARERFAWHRADLAQAHRVISPSRFLAQRCLDRLHLALAPLLIGDGRPGLRFGGAERLADCLRPGCRVFRLGSDQLWDLNLRTAH